MKKLDFYILRKLLTTFVFVVLILVIIICVIDFTEKNDDFIKNDVSRELIAKYYLTFFPFFAVLLTPITTFIAVVFVTAKMAAQTEVVAILAAGISFRRMMVPYFIGAVIIGTMSFYLISYVLPDANKFRIGFELEYLEKPYYFSDRNIHFKIAEHDYIYMDRYNNQRDIGYTVTLEKIEGDELKEKITAKRIEWDTLTNKWSLVSWQKRIIHEDGEEIIEPKKGEYLDTLLTLSPADFKNKERLQETLTLPALSDYIDLQISRGADDVQIYIIERYIRYMQPFTVLVLSFIGVIVSARKSRRGTGYQIALGFLIAFIFIILYTFSRALAEAGSIEPPILAIWMPNILFTLVGLLLYRTVPR